MPLFQGNAAEFGRRQATDGTQKIDFHGSDSMGNPSSPVFLHLSSPVLSVANSPRFIFLIYLFDLPF
jgi:hypothetical protein